VLSSRDFVKIHYVDLKKLNPSLPIYIRPCDGVEPHVAARYGTCHLYHLLPSIQGDYNRLGEVAWQIQSEIYYVHCLSFPYVNQIAACTP
jgi:hypothetical protein